MKLDLCMSSRNGATVQQLPSPTTDPKHQRRNGLYLYHSLTVCQIEHCRRVRRPQQDGCVCDAVSGRVHGRVEMHASQRSGGAEPRWTIHGGAVEAESRVGGADKRHRRTG